MASSSNGIFSSLGNQNPNYPIQSSASFATIVPGSPNSEAQSDAVDDAASARTGADDHSDGEADAESQKEGLDLVPNLGDSGKFLDGTGRYIFPRHRLKGAWEGESQLAVEGSDCRSAD